MPLSTTELAASVVPVLVPLALAQSPTQRLANDADPLLCSVNLVAPVTSIVHVVPFCQPRVKLPVAPLLPHEPVLLTPLTDSTRPETPGGENQTLVAVTVVPEVVP